MYADALVQILGQKALSSDIKLPGGTGKVPYALRSEMGEAIANLLVSDGHHNEIYDIVGSQSYSYEDIAKELQKISGLKIQYKDISEEQFSTNLRNIGFPDFAIYLHAGTIKDIKNHQYEIKSSALQELLGRPTAGITDFLKEIFNLK
jgi:NAD(P)H dehydrogenase (quinone)